MEKIQKTNEEWKKELSKEEYHVLREKGTESAFSGRYWNHHESGIYTCAGCGEQLFSSDTKFDSGTGWPSFYDLMNEKSVILEDDLSYGMNRKEVKCASCGGHLGHVFPDGPKVLLDGRACTGKRFCINSSALKFEKK